MSKLSPKLLFVVADDGYFCTHRFDLAVEARKKGYEVALATHVTNHRQRIEAAGIKVYNLPFHRASLNAFKDASTFFQLFKLYRSFGPDVVHHVALKPVLYGTAAALLAGVPRIVNALGGLGYLFISSTFPIILARFLVTTALFILMRSKRCQFILQNKDDIACLRPFLRKCQIHLIQGAGVNISAFRPAPEPLGGSFTIVLVSRLLWTKGVGEFVEAARLLKPKFPTVTFMLVGDPDLQNPTHVPIERLKAWQQEGLITWLGHQDDIEKIYHQSHIAVLPSYREGLPKSLLEAAACARPIVTTDVPGCRDVVDEGVNGYLVPPYDGPALAAALEKLIQNPKLRQEMGQNSRRKAEKEFSTTLIHAQTFQVYAQEL